MTTQTIIIQSRQHTNRFTYKVASVVFFLILFYVIPLVFKPELLLNWQVIFLATICAIIFITQPQLSISESKQKKSTDKSTVWLIIGVSAIGQISSLIEWAYFPKNSNIFFMLAGAALLIGGTAFRVYAIRTLGNYFSATVQIKSEHRIITPLSVAIIVQRSVPLRCGFQGLRPVIIKTNEHFKKGEDALAA